MTQRTAAVDRDRGGPSPVPQSSAATELSADRYARAVPSRLFATQPRHRRTAIPPWAVADTDRRSDAARRVESRDAMRAAVGRPAPLPHRNAARSPSPAASATIVARSALGRIFDDRAVAKRFATQIGTVPTCDSAWPVADGNVCTVCSRPGDSRATLRRRCCNPDRRPYRSRSHSVLRSTAIVCVTGSSLGRFGDRYRARCPSTQIVRRRHAIAGRSTPTGTCLGDLFAGGVDIPTESRRPARARSRRQTGEHHTAATTATPSDEPGDGEGLPSVVSIAGRRNDGRRAACSNSASDRVRRRRRSRLWGALSGGNDRAGRAGRAGGRARAGRCP